MGVLLSWANLTTAVTLSSAHSTASGFDLASLLTTPINDVWRSASWGATTITLDVDLGTARTVNVVAIAAPRDSTLPSATATVTLTAGTTQGGSTALNTGSQTLGLSPWGVWGWRSTAGVSARWWRLALTGTASDTFLQLGRVWVGAALITTRGYAFGATRGGRDPGVASRSGLSGTRYATLGRTYRVERLTLPALSSAEATSVETAAAAVGATGQVFLARSDATLGQGLFGCFSEPPSVSRPYPQLLSADIQVEEDA